MGVAPSSLPCAPRCPQNASRPAPPHTHTPDPHPLLCSLLAPGLQPCLPTQPRPLHPATSTAAPTPAGFRRLGFNLLISALAVPFIHGSFSYPTSHSWIPDPRLPIYLDRMHRTKHGSDSEVGV